MKIGKAPAPSPSSPPAERAATEVVADVLAGVLLELLVRERTERSAAAEEIGYLEARDTLQLEKRSGKLSICMDSPLQHERCRQEFGRILHGDAEWFQRLELYTGRPLVDVGPAALSCDGIEGLEQVTVSEVRVRRPGTPQERAWTHVESAFFASREWRRATLHHEVCLLKLAFHLSGRPHEYEVEIVPPNTLGLDRRYLAHHAHLFLPRRGFMKSV